MIKIKTAIYVREQRGYRLFNWVGNEVAFLPEFALQELSSINGESDANEELQDAGERERPRDRRHTRTNKSRSVELKALKAKYDAVTYVEAKRMLNVSYEKVRMLAFSGDLTSHNIEEEYRGKIKFLVTLNSIEKYRTKHALDEGDKVVEKIRHRTSARQLLNAQKAAQLEELKKKYNAVAFSEASKLLDMSDMATRYRVAIGALDAIDIYREHSGYTKILITLDSINKFIANRK